MGAGSSRGLRTSKALTQQTFSDFRYAVATTTRDSGFHSSVPRMSRWQKVPRLSVPTPWGQVHFGERMGPTPLVQMPWGQVHFGERMGPTPLVQMPCWGQVRSGALMAALRASAPTFAAKAR